MDELSTTEQEEALREITPEIVSRAEWGAKRPTSRRKLKTPVPKVVFCFTDTLPCYSRQQCIKQMKDLQREHMERSGKSDINHNFLISKDGSVFEGRGWQYCSSKLDSPDVAHLNDTSIQVAFLQPDVLHPNAAQKRAALGLMTMGIKNKHLTEDVGLYFFDFDEPLFKDESFPTEDEAWGMFQETLTTESDTNDEDREEWRQFEEDLKRRNQRAIDREKVGLFSDLEVDSDDDTGLLEIPKENIQ